MVLHSMRRFTAQCLHFSEKALTLRGEQLHLLVFWTIEQATYYYSWILCFKNRIFEHKYLDIDSMEELPCFNIVLNQIDELHLKRFLKFNHGWNLELILQFYATLYASDDRMDNKIWTFEWMSKK